MFSKISSKLDEPKKKSKMHFDISKCVLQRAKLLSETKPRTLCKTFEIKFETHFAGLVYLVNTRSQVRLSRWAEICSRKGRLYNVLYFSSHGCQDHMTSAVRVLSINLKKYLLFFLHVLLQINKVGIITNYRITNFQANLH